MAAGVVVGLHQAVVTRGPSNDLEWLRTLSGATRLRPDLRELSSDRLAVDEKSDVDVASVALE